MDSAMARANRSGDDPEIADGLTRREHDILAFERQWWKYAGAKEDAIKELFSMSATRYYQVLNALVDRPEALAADPMLVKRLRRLRASRQKARAARRLSPSVSSASSPDCSVRAMAPSMLLVDPFLHSKPRYRYGDHSTTGSVVGPSANRASRHT